MAAQDSGYSSELLEFAQNNGGNNGGNNGNDGKTRMNPWLGMVEIPPIKIMMTGGWFSVMSWW